jgi:hypothetical protein
MEKPLIANEGNIFRIEEDFSGHNPEGIADRSDYDKIKRIDDHQGDKNEKRVIYNIKREIASPEAYFEGTFYHKEVSPILRAILFTTTRIIKLITHCIRPIAEVKENRAPRSPAVYT